MVLPRALPRRRVAVLAALLVVALALVGLGTGPAAPSAVAGETVCRDVVRGAAASRDVRQGGRPNGRLLGRVWIHLKRDGTSCVVLRAVAYKGTPHYMSLQVCRVGSRPWDCTGTDAGKYRYYAGPIDYYMGACQQIRVKIDVPGGRRLTDQWVYGACN